MMGQNVFCSECGTNVPVRIESREKSFTVKGMTVEAVQPVSVCLVCGAVFSTAAQADEGVSNSYRAYRALTGVISPKDIIELRGRYNASQKAFGLILGFGELTMNTYEKGSIPSEVHQKILASAHNAKWFAEQFEKAKRKLGPIQINRISQALEQLLPNAVSLPSASCGASTAPAAYGALAVPAPPVSAVYSVRGDDVYCAAESSPPYYVPGCGEPAFEKIFAMMVCILLRVPGLYKMKLLKMLFYADFANYQQNSRSMSGCEYVRLHFGPVPLDYETLMYQAVQRGAVCVQPDEEERGDIWNACSASAPLHLKLLNPEEKAVLENVCDTIGSYTAVQLSALIREEDVWLKTEEGSVINYELARNLKAVHV